MCVKKIIFRHFPSAFSKLRWVNCPFYSLICGNTNYDPDTFFGRVLAFVVLQLIGNLGHIIGNISFVLTEIRSYNAFFVQKYHKTTDYRCFCCQIPPWNIGLFCFPNQVDAQTFIFLEKQ